MKGLQSNLLKLFIIAAIFLCNNIFAQGTSDALRLGVTGLGADARALGMGNSYIGLSDDGSGAAFFNPAGWALIKKIEFSGGLSFDSYGNNTQLFNSTSDISGNSTKLNNLSLALPFPTMQGSFVVGIAYHTTKNFNASMKFDGFNNGSNSLIQDLNKDVYYDNKGNPFNIPFDLFLTDTNFINNPNEKFNTVINGKLNQSGSIIESGALNNWTLSAAFEAYKNLFLGLNLNFISGTYENVNDYFEDDSKGVYSNIQIDPSDPRTRGFQTFNLHRVINWDLSGWDAKFGMLYQIKNNARIGLTIQFPKTYTVKEKFTVDGYSQFATGFNPSLDESVYSDNVQYDIVTPFELAGGFSMNLRDLILSAQATLIDYSQLKFQNADGISTQDINTANSDIQNSLHSVFNYNIGAEYNIPDLGFRLRGGFMYMPSPYTGDPSNYDHKYITVGAGLLVEGGAGFDVAYVHGWWSNFGDNYGTNVSRTLQDIKEDQVVLSIPLR